MPVDIPYQPYLVSLAIIFVGFLGGKIAEFLITRVARTPMAPDWYEPLSQAAAPPARWLAVAAGLYLGYQALPDTLTTSEWDPYIEPAAKAVFILFVAWAGMRMFDALMVLMERRADRTDTKLDDQLVPILRKAGKAFIWLIGGLMVLQNLGFSVTSLVAGFGIGSAAIALAAKDTLSNVFGSIVIFFDRPFMIGDWIEMGAIEGTVEEVGVRTTRIRTFANAMITIPNAKFTNEAITNWSRMRKRRIRFTLELTYGTTVEQAEAIVADIRSLIANDPEFNQDLTLINVSGLGASGWEIFVYCFTNTTVWAEFMNKQEAFLLDVWRIVERNGGALAYPSQSLYIESVKASTGQSAQ